MGKHKTANRGGTNLQKGASPFPSSQNGEEGDMVWDPIEEIASVEEVLLHLDTSPKMPFRFRRTSQLSSERSASSEHQHDLSLTPKDRRCYCIWVRVMLGDRGGDQPPPSHAWGGCLITDILLEAWLEDQITKAMVLSPEEAILFFGRCSRNEGLPYHGTRNVEFGLGGAFNWARRPTQIEALRKTMQEGHHTIIKAVVKKQMNIRGPGWPWRKEKPPKTPAAACDIEEWMWGFEEASDGEQKQNDDTDCSVDQQSIHSQWRSQSQRRHRWQRALRVPREPSGGLPSLGGDSLDRQSEWSLQHSNQTTQRFLRRVADQGWQEEASW